MFRPEQATQYTNALLLSTAKRKTASSLAEERHISGDQALRWLDASEISPNYLIENARDTLDKRRKIALVIDDTLIAKHFAKEIAGAADHYNASKGIVEHALCSVTAMLTDGKTNIPVSHNLWIPKELAGDRYKTKVELAQQLIASVIEKMRIDIVLLDGLYATKEMIGWLIEHKTAFEMRFHSNRILEFGGARIKIKDIPRLKLKRGKHARTIAAIWHGMMLYFTIVKRINRRGNAVISYQVSNNPVTCFEHARWYKLRWNIEEFFRTAKQSLGLNDCQCRKFERQNAHITSVFLAFAIAESRRVKYRLKNTETAIKSIKSDYFASLGSPKDRSAQIFTIH